MRLYRFLGLEGKITIPQTLRQQTGFSPGDVVSFEVVSPGVVLVRREQLQSPDSAPETDIPSLKEFLESLSQKEQYVALVHLSVLWAQSHGGNSNGRDEN